MTYKNVFEKAKYYTAMSEVYNLHLNVVKNVLKVYWPREIQGANIFSHSLFNTRDGSKLVRSLYVPQRTKLLKWSIGYDVNALTHDVRAIAATARRQS